VSRNRAGLHSEADPGRNRSGPRRPRRSAHLAGNPSAERCRLPDAHCSFPPQEGPRPGTAARYPLRTSPGLWSRRPPLTRPQWIWGAIRRDTQLRGCRRAVGAI